MVCRECGTRNLPDEAFCARCGAGLKPAAPLPPSPEPEARSAAEERAAEVRACLAKGDLKRAMDLAKEAVSEEPDAALSHILLGDVYLRIDANDDALREFRHAVELDSDNAEAREKAEVARKRILQPRAARTEAPGTVVIGPLEIRRHLIPYIAGAAAALLVFCVGAATIVSRTLPQAQQERLFGQQMALGSRHYRAGRYTEAADAFAQAVALDPSSEIANRRLRDAQVMAGIAPTQVAAWPGDQQEPRVATLGPTTTPGHTAFQPSYVGPRPGQPTTQNAPQTPRSAPPPPIPVPNPTGADSSALELPPPIPPSTVAGDESPETGGAGGVPGGIGAEASGAASPTQTTAREHAMETTQPSKPRGEIVIERVPRRNPPAPQPSAQTAPQKTSTGEVLRAEADRLRHSGRLAEAIRKYSEAEAQLRLEAAQSGPDAATKKAAAITCERAREACESHLEAPPSPQ